MFRPIYKLNTDLLNNIVKIKNIINELNDQKFPSIVLAEFEKDSYAVSAFASTSIEGNPIPLTDVRKILKQHSVNVRDSEREILNYNKALEYLNQLVPKQNKVDSNFMCKIQSIVIDNLIDKKNIGKIRTDAVVVNNPKKRQIVYIPPDAKDVPDLTGELSDYLAREYNSTDPLILAGIFHKQFVIIHPFMDGNGRTTRLITKYLLAKVGLDTFKLFSFENYYNKNVNKYFSSVGVYGDYYEIRDDIDFTDWLIYFTGGIIDELLRVQKLLENKSSVKRIEKHERVILDYINEHNSISKSEYSQITDRARSTQILDFKRMIDKGLIIREKKSKATYYILNK
jgi:Fic family protein